MLAPTGGNWPGVAGELDFLTASRRRDSGASILLDERLQSVKSG